MKILVVHNRYRSVLPSGEDRVVDQEIDLLRRAGHDVTWFGRQSDDIARMPLTQKAMVPLRVPWNGAVRSQLAERLRCDRPDVVHVHNTFPLLSPSVLDACREAGTPVVATLHNSILVCPIGTLMRKGQACGECVGRIPLPAVRHGCYRDSHLASVPMAINLMVNRGRWLAGVSRFLCVSHAHRRILVAAGLPADRLSVKHHFVHDTPFRRAEPGEYVLFLGRLTEDKGLPLLMAAWERTDTGGVPLVVAGDGPLREEFLEWARDRGDVRYAGLVSHEECRGLLASAAALVAPSKARESFGLVLTEAMAAGVPVVASGHGGFTDIVEHGVTGLLHKPFDAASLSDELGRVLSDMEFNMTLGRAARRAYEHRFSPDVGLAALLEAYHAVISPSDGMIEAGRRSLPEADKVAGQRDRREIR